MKSVVGGGWILHTCDLNVSLFIQEDAEREGRKTDALKETRHTEGHGGPRGAAQALGQHLHAGWGRQVTCCSQTWPSDRCFPGQQLLLGRERRHIRGAWGAKGTHVLVPGSAGSHCGLQV